MMSPSSDQRTWEHYVVAQVGRAAAGLIAAEVVGLAAEITSDAVVLHAAVVRLDDGLVDDLNHICFELDVLLDGHVQISHSETVWAQRPWPPAGWHPIYVAKARTEPPTVVPAAGDSCGLSAVAGRQPRYRVRHVPGYDGDARAPMFGDSITTRVEHTVNPRPPGESLHGSRIVTGSDGSVWARTDHFNPWTRVR